MATRSRSTKKPADAPEFKTYLLTMEDGKRKKVTVPASWKVTFGPLVPGGKDTNYNSRGALSLRFWEGKDLQRAVFTGVASFRDQSIGIEEEIIRSEEQVFTKEVDGEERNFVAQAVVREWQNPDAPRAAMKQNLLHAPNERAIFADCDGGPDAVR